MSRLISLAGVKWSCLRINKQASPPQEDREGGARPYLRKPKAQPSTLNPTLNPQPSTLNLDSKP